MEAWRQWLTRQGDKILSNEKTNNSLDSDWPSHGRRLHSLRTCEWKIGIRTPSRAPATPTPTSTPRAHPLPVPRPSFHIVTGSVTRARPLTKWYWGCSKIPSWRIYPITV
jgi:hypothetical protein